MKPVRRHLDEAAPPAGGPAGTGVLLLHLGGPDSADAILPFYRELWSDPEIVPAGVAGWFGGRGVAKAVAAAEEDLKRSYGFIGARSPVRDLVGAQAAALENHLNGRAAAALPGGGAHRVFPALRYGTPRIRDAVAAALAAGVKRLVLLPLYPQASRATSGVCLAEARAALSDLGYRGPVTSIERFADDPGYLDAMIARTRHTFSLIPPQLRDGAFLLFSVHSPPAARAKADDYLAEIERTAQAVMRAVGYDESRADVAFQNNGGPCAWMEPATAAAVRAKAEAGTKALVLVPISFVTDGFETLYELDIRAYKEGAEHGIVQCRRVATLNADAAFIAALARLVAATVESA